ncbi:MAG: hypothetical protein V1907_01145 [Candidatus Kerfeldbacteria bacterium]
MESALLGILGGGIVSWVITFAYYRRSSKKAPEWAQPLIERFGNEPPTTEQLMEYFNEAVAGGEIIPHVPSGYVMCPKCKAPSSELEYGEADYDDRELRGSWVKCRKCGWSEFLGDV